MIRLFEYRMRRLAYNNKRLNHKMMEFKRSLDEVMDIINGTCKKKHRGGR